MLAGLVALRWAAWAWMALVLGLGAHEMLRPWLAAGLVAAAFVYTALATVWLETAPQRLLGLPALAVEFAIATALVLCDGWAYGAGHAFSTSQSIGSVWPLVAVLTLGLAFGRAAGAAGGVLLGAAKVGATLANGVRHFDSARTTSLVSTTVFYVVAGVVAAYVMALLRRAETEISAARARDEIARTLHDGVLQTLAVVERRSTDADLVRMAREQDRALRRFLFGDGASEVGPRELGAALRAAAARFEDRFGLRAEVLVPFDLPSLDEARIEAITGAVNEAMTNAGKHAHAHRLTVFVEPAGAGGIFCSVKDDGRGFDVEATPAGVGLSRSITQRMQDAGGRAEVRSRPETGTEVCLWL